MTRGGHVATAASSGTRVDARSRQVLGNLAGEALGCPLRWRPR